MAHKHTRKKAPHRLHAKRYVQIHIEFLYLDKKNLTHEKTTTIICTFFSLCKLFDK